MSSHPWRSVSIALVIGLVIGGASMNSDSQIKKLEDDVAAARGQSQDAQLRIGELEGEVADLEEENSGLDQDLGDATDEASTFEAELAALRAKRPMPNLVGKSESAVANFDSDYGWNVEISRQGSESSEGTILSQQPAAGMTMKSGAAVMVTIAKPLPPGWKDVAVFSGSGQTNTEPFAIHGKSRVLYSFSGGTNASMTLYKVPRRYTELLLNEIGSMQGSTRLYYSGRFWMEICCGSFTVRIQEWR